MTVREILQRREAIRQELRAIVDKHADGNLPDEVAERSTELEREAERLNAAERRQVLIDEMDRRAVGVPLDGGGGDAGFEAEAAKVTLSHIIAAQMGMTDAAAGRARAVSDELTKRSGLSPPQGGLWFSMRHSGVRVRRPETRVFTSAMPTPGGGALIATDLVGFIDRLREATICRRLGCTVLADLVGNVSIPRLKASATGYWVAENQAVTASDPQTDAVPLSMKTVGGLVELSRTMILQPSIDAQVMVENDLAAIIGVAIDRAALKGGGTNEPKGLLDVSSGIHTVGMGGTPLSWNDIIDMIGDVAVANALGGSLAFATDAYVVKKLRKTLRTTGDTSSNFIMNDATTLAGYPIAASQVMPNMGYVSGGGALSNIIYGDWSMLVIGAWDQISILVNPFDSVAYPKGNVLVRALASIDVAVKQPLAFSARLAVGT